MTEILCPDNILEEIRADQLPEKVMEKLAEGYRFSQACAATIGDHVELSYSLADDETFQFYTFRILPQEGEEVPSISRITPAAIFYENEMRELFGVNIRLISLDLQDKMYRINEVTPFAPEKKEGN